MLSYDLRLGLVARFSLIYRGNGLTNH